MYPDRKGIILDIFSSILHFREDYAMLGTRYESYRDLTDRLPFVLYTDLKRTPFHCSQAQNWHDNPELQLCTDGEGEVLLNGTRYAFRKGDLIAVNANILHYTRTDTSLTYCALIISTDFCARMGIDCGAIAAAPCVRDVQLVQTFLQLVETVQAVETPLRIARLNQLLLTLLIGLGADSPSAKTTAAETGKTFEAVKAAISLIGRQYAQKLILEDIARAVLLDKYTLCREFKRFTGQTVFQYLNRYRCQRAVEYLENGRSVSEAAALCGYDNLSFFTKTFRTYMGELPSRYKKPF